ncbi:MAG TPA: 4-hydroxy-3-methylbut-2-enyl diphosphate reductase [Candidatus Dormibacteraeota bacterium]
MDVLKITPRGYCHGVVEAIRAAKQTARAHPGEKIRMLGYLVHNVHVTDELQENGIELVDRDNRLEGLDQIEGGTVIFTAHGVAPAVKQRAQERGLNMVDATCSDVVVTHDLVKDLVERGYDVVYIGRRGHPEPEGVVGEAPGRVHLVQDPEDVDALSLENDKIAVTCQTTLSIWDTASMIKRVRERYPKAEAYNEICRATQDRQEAAVEAAADCDLVIVVGSERSSNSKRLVQVVQELAHKPAYLVDTVADIKPEWLEGKVRVGVTSGASTPTQLTRQVIEYLEAL